MKYILLGGCGYFGYNFRKYLMKYEGADENDIIIFDKVQNPSGFETLDLSEFDAAYKVCQILKAKNFLKNKDEIINVINFAAVSFVDTSLIKDIENYRNNLNVILSFIELVRVLRDNFTNVKALHISTDEVCNKYEKCTEDRSAYSVGKDIGESIILNTLNDVIILRPSNLFGCVEYSFEYIQRNPCVIKNLINHIYDIYVTDTVSRRFMHIMYACEIVNSLLKGKSTKVDEIRENVYITLSDDEIKIADLIRYVAMQDAKEFIYLPDNRGKKQDNDYNVYYKEYMHARCEMYQKINWNYFNLSDIYKDIIKQRLALELHEHKQQE